MISPVVVYMTYKTIAYLDVSHNFSIAGGLEGGGIRLSKNLGVKFFDVSNQHKKMSLTLVGVSSIFPPYLVK